MHIRHTLQRRPCLLLCVFLLYAHFVAALDLIGKRKDSVDDDIDTLSKGGRKPDPLDLGDGARYNYCQADFPSAEQHPSPRVANSKLMSVQMLIRHGARSSTKFYSRDKELDWVCSNLGSMSFSETGTDTVPEHVARVVMTPPPPDSPFAAAHWKGSCDLGQLTLKGALQQQVLGRALRGIYVDRFKLLSNHWDPDQLWVRSTTVERVKQSAENLIEGLYNESTRSLIAGGHPSTFSILMYPSSIDYLTMPTGPCPRISELQDEQKAPKNKVLEKIERDNMAFMKKLGDWMGFEGGTGDYIEATMPRSCNGFPLQCRLPSSTPKTKRDGSQQEEVGEEDKETKEQDPENCVTQAIIDRVIDIDSQISAETLRDDPGAFTILQLGMGSLVKDIRDNIQAAVKDGVQNTTSPAFRLYSGHDTTILPMLAVFDSLDLNWPPFASNILIELWKTPSSNNNQGQHFVRLFYNSRVIRTKSSWCDLAWCPLDQFIKYLDRFVVADLLAQCKPKKPAKTEDISELFVNKDLL